ncbi:PQQ-binding-like beta-propeller repeat protein [bacterium]|nr:PQQ-binding-like beta-propeller repeat protein [bacterium]
MSIANTSSDEPLPVVTRPRHTRWWLGSLILGAGMTAQALLWMRYVEDPTFAKMSVLWVWPATLFALLLWWLFASGLSWATKLIPLGLLALGGVGFFSVYRIDGSDGDMVPRLAYRWVPTAEQQARDYWKQQTIPESSPTNSETPSEGTIADGVEAPEPTADDWPDFRGPKRDGIVRGIGFRTDWEKRPPQELWRHPVGLGWSSFVVLDDYAITMEQRDEQESVVAYSLKSGEPLWLHGDDVRFQAVEVNGGDGPHATPVISGDRVFSLGATGLLNCLELNTGKSLWSRNILTDAGAPGAAVKNLEWGVSGSPLVVDDLIITIPGTAPGRSVLAYDRTTGEIVWAGGTFPASYGGPAVAELNGVRQVLIYHGTGIAAFELGSGKELWSFPWENMPKVNAAQPMIVSDSSLVIGTGYGIGATLLKLTAEEKGPWGVSADWKTNRLKLKFNDAILLDGYIYGLDDGILTCVDVATGKTKWKGGRYGYGQILAHESTILALTEDGDVALAKAQPTRFEEIGRFHALDGTTWNHPAVAHGKLLIRNGSMAACYDVAP